MPARPLIALLDCNSFYASVERAEDPSLLGQPVAVLSSNDGCIIAQSDEVKKLGIPVGEPYFKIREELEQKRVRIFSANFDLYTDYSAKIMTLLQQRVPHLEVYSIDEAFMHLTGMARYHDLHAFCADIRQEILEEVGVPVSIGVSYSRVLAKVANKYAKQLKTSYVEILLDEDAIEAHLRSLPIGQLWGINRGVGSSLNELDVHTAWDLRNISDVLMHKRFTIVQRRLVDELRGRLSTDLSHLYRPKKHIATSRSFGHAVTRLPDLEEAVAWFTSKAARKLRKQHSVAGRIHVGVRTNKHRRQDEQQHGGWEVALPAYTNYTPLLIRYAVQAVRQLYRPGYRYAKASVMLSDIRPAGAMQASLFNNLATYKYTRLMHAVDEINTHYACTHHQKDVVTWAKCAGKDETWRPRGEHLSAKRHLEGVTEAQRDIARPWW